MSLEQADGVFRTALRHCLFIDDATHEADKRKSDTESMTWRSIGVAEGRIKLV